MRALAIALLALLLFAGTSALFAATPPAETASPKFATADWDRITAGYQAYRQAAAEFNHFLADINNQREMNQRLRLLEDNEVQELKDLRTMVALTPEQKIRLQQLESLSDAREQEFTTLSQKGQLTADEQARMNALTQIARKRAPAVEAEDRRLQQVSQKKNEEMSAPFSAAVQNALEKVAKQHNVSVIFTKDSVLWASLDLTDEVLTELNKTKPAPAAAPAVTPEKPR